MARGQVVSSINAGCESPNHRLKLLLPFVGQESVVDTDADFWRDPHQKVDVAFDQRSLALHVVHSERQADWSSYRMGQQRKDLEPIFFEEALASFRKVLLNFFHVVDEKWAFLTVAEHEDTPGLRVVEVEAFPSEVPDNFGRVSETSPVFEKRLVRVFKLIHAKEDNLNNDVSNEESA